MSEESIDTFKIRNRITIQGTYGILCISSIIKLNESIARRFSCNPYTIKSEDKELGTFLTNKNKA